MKVLKIAFAYRNAYGTTTVFATRWFHKYAITIDLEKGWGTIEAIGPIRSGATPVKIVEKKSATWAIKVPGSFFKDGQVHDGWLYIA